jgi:hypothetical protein
VKRFEAENGLNRNLKANEGADNEQISLDQNSTERYYEMLASVPMVRSTIPTDTPKTLYVEPSLKRMRGIKLDGVPALKRLRLHVGQGRKGRCT